MSDYTGEKLEHFIGILRPDGSVVKQSPHWGSACWKSHPASGVYGYPGDVDLESVETATQELTDALVRQGVRREHAVHTVVRFTISTGVAVDVIAPSTQAHDACKEQDDA